MNNQHQQPNLTEYRKAIEVELAAKLLAKSINYDEVERLMERLNIKKVDFLHKKDNASH